MSMACIGDNEKARENEGDELDRVGLGDYGMGEELIVIIFLWLYIWPHLIWEHKC